MLSVISLLFILIILFGLIRDFLRNPAGSLINPLFLLLFYSTFYFLLPLLYIDIAIDAIQLQFTESGKYWAFGWSFWYVTVFYIFYQKSSKYTCEIVSVRISNMAYRFSLLVYCLIILLLLFILIRYVPSVYSLHDNRGAALNLYEETINSRFKLRILMYCHYATTFILYLKKRTLLYLLPCLLYFLIDYSHGGRTVSLMTLTFVYFVIVLQTRKTYMLPVICIVFVMVMVGVIQRSTSTDLIWSLYMAGAEFSTTYMTTLYLSDHPDYMLDGFSYLLVSLSKLLPGGFVDRLLGFGEWYGNPLSAQIGLGYGLAGNLITESLVYGGRIFSVFQPILIGGICFLVNRMKGRKSLFGVLYSLLLVISMQNIVRSYFWGFVLYPIQILWFYLFFLNQDYSKKIFK